MSLQFILGTASHDHHQVLVTDLQTALKKAPTDDFFYLVPNHVKFESEVQLLSELAEPNTTYTASTQVQVFSFSRLAWYFMKNTPFYQLPRITTAGLNMLVYRLLQQNADELQLFSGEVNQTGFVAQLTQQLLTLRVGCVDAASLNELAAQLQPEQVELAAKLHDLTIIATAFEAALADQFIENTSLITTLATYLQETDLSRSHFYIEGFAQFNAQEQALITTLLMQANEVTLALTLDRGYVQQPPEKLSFFYQSGQTYFSLYQQARQHQVPVKLDQQATQVRVSQDLEALDQYWISSQTAGPIPAAKQSMAQLRVVGVENRYAELRWVAKQIRYLVRTQHYRYRDFIILTRQLAPYQNMIAPIMTEYELPYFCDLATGMADHPVVAMLESLLAVKEHYYRYEDIMSLLKTELLLPSDSKGHFQNTTDFRVDLDLCENLVLQNGYSGHDWLQADDWQYYRYGSFTEGTQTTQDAKKAQRINHIRHFIKDTLPPFYRRLDAAKNGTEAIKVLYQFLIKQGVDQQLLHWRDQALNEEQLTEAAKPEQTWTTLMSMFDDYVTLLGEQTFVASDFWDLLAAGFAKAQYAQIPATLDQVVLSESGMVQMKQHRITFMIGSTDQMMPAQIEHEQLLSDTETDYLNAQLATEQFLPDSSQLEMSFEPYLNYLAFLTSREALYFTYPLSDSDGQQFKLSPYVQRIKQHFNLVEQQVSAQPAFTTTQPEGAWRSLISDLIQVGQQAQARQVLIPDVWLQVYHALDAKPVSQYLLQQLLPSLIYQNIPETLQPEIVTGLYGQEIQTSISKLEEFYQNQYAYFLKYGLKLAERPVFELTPANTGDLYHQVLDQLLKEIKKQHLVIEHLTATQIDDLIETILHQAYQQPEFRILLKTARMGYIRQQLKQTLQRVGQALQFQSQRSAMHPLATEVLFGQIGADKGLSGLSFDIGEKRRLQVRGKIDRIDQLVVADQTYLGIVDYKSSSHKFNFSEAYYGLALQMLTYLETVLDNQDKLVTTKQPIKPAGAFYLHLKNPVLSLNKLTRAKLALLQSGQITQALLDQFKYNGFLLDDETLLDNLDTELKNGQHSPLFNFNKLSKDGAYRSKQFVTLANLDLLLSHNNQQIKAAGEAIFSGQTALNPIMRTDRTNALTYSPFKAIFQFDAMLPENNYRLIQSLSAKEVIEKLKEGLGDQADE